MCEIFEVPTKDKTDDLKLYVAEFCRAYDLKMALLEAQIQSLKTEIELLKLKNEKGGI